MDTTFIYKGKKITTPNLEKKLKRMKITLDEIEIITVDNTKKEQTNELEIPLEKYHLYKYPNKEEWHCYITDNPPDSIEFNNQILMKDEQQRVILLAL